METKYIIAAVVALVLVLAGTWYYMSKKKAPEATPDAAPEATPEAAVAPAPAPAPAPAAAPAAPEPALPAQAVVNKKSQLQAVAAMSDEAAAAAVGRGQQVVKPRVMPAQLYDEQGRPITMGPTFLDADGLPIKRTRTLYDREGRPVNMGTEEGRPMKMGRKVFYDEEGRPMKKGFRIDEEGRPIKMGRKVFYDEEGRPMEKGFRIDEEGRPIKMGRKVFYDEEGRPIKMGQKAVDEEGRPIKKVVPVDEKGRPIELGTVAVDEEGRPIKKKSGGLSATEMALVGGGAGALGAAGVMAIKGRKKNRRMFGKGQKKRRRRSPGRPNLSTTDMMLMSSGGLGTALVGAKYLASR
ncbi:immunoglobulin-like and fibronectin type III domain-containing protein 1 [Dishui Lake phycodnavirus 3]|nr:immunoglobulin-like and fibronectin type III domain-containing protein 1 [Dishui Lake phycodnavirus 3]